MTTLVRARTISIVFSFAATLLTSGCQTAYNAVGIAYPPTASTAHKFDGSYQGSIRQVSATGPGCTDETGERVIMIGDGVLWYDYTPDALFAAPVNNNGVIDAAVGDTTMIGHITGNHLKATIKSPTCVTQLSMDYIFNHS